MECTHKILVLPLAAQHPSKSVALIECQYCEMIVGNATWYRKPQQHPIEVIQYVQEFSPPLRNDQEVVYR